MLTGGCQRQKFARFGRGLQRDPRGLLQTPSGFRLLFRGRKIGTEKSMEILIPVQAAFSTSQEAAPTPVWAPAPPKCSKGTWNGLDVTRRRAAHFPSLHDLPWKSGRPSSTRGGGFPYVPTAASVRAAAVSRHHPGQEVSRENCKLLCCLPRMDYWPLELNANHQKEQKGGLEMIITWPFV